jgi:hypothetical protein
VIPTRKNDQEILQLLGLGTAGKLNITIDLNERPKSSLFSIEPTNDNRALIENLHDLYRQLNDVYLNNIQTWMNVFINVQENSNEQQTTIIMKRAIDLKNSIQNCLKMIQNYHLAPKRTVVTQKSGSFFFIQIQEIRIFNIFLAPAPKITLVAQSSPSESVCIILLHESLEIVRPT